MQVQVVGRGHHEVIADVVQRIAERADPGTAPRMHVQTPHARGHLQIHQHGHRGRRGVQGAGRAQRDRVGVEVETAGEGNQGDFVAADPHGVAVAGAGHPIHGIGAQHEGRAVGPRRQAGLVRPARPEIEGPGHRAGVVGPRGIVAGRQIADDGDASVGAPAAARAVQLQHAAADLDVAGDRSRQVRDPAFADVVRDVGAAEMVQGQGHGGPGGDGGVVGFPSQPDAV